MNINDSLSIVQIKNFFLILIFGAYSSLNFQSLLAQCPVSLGCNSSVQISLDYSCQAVITPDLVLEGSDTACEYYVTILDENDVVLIETTYSGGTPTWPVIDGSFVGKNSKASVHFINDNNTEISCWGWFTVEDKLPPTITCIDDFTVSCNEDLSNLFNSTTTAEYNNTSPTDLDSDPNTVTVELCLDGTGPNPWELIESASLDWPTATDPDGNGFVNTTGVNYNVSFNGLVIDGQLLGTTSSFGNCIEATFPVAALPGGTIGITLNSVSFFEFQIVDNCDPNTEVLITKDEIVRLDCTDDITARREIQYFTKDEAGLSTANCDFSIFFTKKNLSDIVFPSNRNYTCDDPEINTNGTLDLDPSNTGFPTLGGMELLEDNLCKMNVTFSDDTFNLCGINSIKILRRWTALDWCAGEYGQSYQTIKIEDDQRPIVSCPQDDMVFKTTTGCVANVVFKPLDSNHPTGVLSFTDCSIMDVKVEFLRADERDVNDVDQPFNPAIDNDNFIFTATGLQSGRNWIKYIFTDECNLSTECRFEVIIEDDSAPIPVCDQFTAVSLANNGWGRLYPEAIDDGSYDECGGDVSLEIKRTSTNCAQFSSDKTFGEFVSFCCEEAGETIMVQLRVTDSGGRSNTCEVSVIVQDKSGFELTSCPQTVFNNLKCDDDLSPDLRGRPVISEDCGAGTIGFDDTGSFDDDCGIGKITRQWFIEINGGKTNICEQEFNINSNVTLTENSFVWPADRDDATCENYTTDLGDNVMYNGKPVNEAQFCGDLSFSYEDAVFNTVEGYCVKVIRRYTVIDFCTYDIATGAGIWSRTQIIKVKNNAGPQLMNCPTDTSLVITNSDCETSISFDAPSAFDACLKEDIPENRISYALTEGTNVLSTGTGNTSSFILTPGTYEVTWSVFGVCDNESTCSHSIIVKDEKRPTPYCKGGVTTVLMPPSSPGESPSVALWASDFDLGSTDNCSTNLTVSFEEDDPNATSIEFTCADLGMQSLIIWFTDASGNKDFCQTTVNIQANGGICDGGISNSMIIAGNVETEFNEVLENVTISLQSMEDQSMSFESTNINGHFAFGGMEAYGDYKVNAVSDSDYLNGVSTLDLVLIQQHILGTQPFDSPYKLIAADANNSESVSAIDLIELRKLILGIYDELPDSESWRFLDSSKKIQDAQNPWPIKESIDLSNLIEDEMQNDFLAVKVGDVNGTVEVNNFANNVDVAARNNNSVKLTMDVLSISDFDEYLLPFYLEKEMNLYGLQIKLNLDKSLTIKELDKGKLDLSETNYNIEANTVTISWNSNKLKAIKEGEALFYITVKSENSINESLIFEDQDFKSELYTSDYEVISINIGDFQNEYTTRLYQNTPNPFSNVTNIQFELSKSSLITMKIFDQEGRVIKTLSDSYEKGIHNIKLDSKSLNGNGIYYYQLETELYSGIKKMILID